MKFIINLAGKKTGTNELEIEMKISSCFNLPASGDT